VLAIARDLERALSSLRSGQLKIRIAKQTGLFQRKRGCFFHTTPELFIQTGGAQISSARVKFSGFVVAKFA
jgi:hypothetical protein